MIPLCESSVIVVDESLKHQQAKHTLSKEFFGDESSVGGDHNHLIHFSILHECNHERFPNVQQTFKTSAAIAERYQQLNCYY